MNLVSTMSQWLCPFIKGSFQKRWVVCCLTLLPLFYGETLHFCHMHFDIYMKSIDKNLRTGLGCNVLAAILCKNAQLSVRYRIKMV